MGRLDQHDATRERVEGILEDPDTEIQETIIGDSRTIFVYNKGEFEIHDTPYIYPKE